MVMVIFQLKIAKFGFASWIYKIYIIFIKPMFSPLNCIIFNYFGTTTSLFQVIYFNLLNDAVRLSARNWPNLHLKHYSFSISDECRAILEGDSIVDSDISDGIIEISSMFKILYTDANVLICGILPPDCYWLINGVYIKDVNEFFK